MQLKSGQWQQVVLLDFLLHFLMALGKEAQKKDVSFIEVALF